MATGTLLGECILIQFEMVFSAQHASASKHVFELGYDVATLSSLSMFSYLTSMSSIICAAFEPIIGLHLSLSLSMTTN
jgi:hypothetical protein